MILCVCMCVMPSNQRKPWLSLCGFAASPSSRNAWLHSQMTHTPSSELKPGLNAHTLPHGKSAHTRMQYMPKYMCTNKHISTYSDPTRCVYNLICIELICTDSHTNLESLLCFTYIIMSAQKYFTRIFYFVFATPFLAYQKGNQSP